MSKAGNNYYYLQDELGSPMYMTGTDGVAVSSYAFDDFGRNIDPRTGKQKKHGYTTDGNIIQPFAFTGYQEDEVSGLKFAQARFYDANTGRFQSEDNVKGFINSPFTLNHYGYCWGNPIGLVDNDGNWPEWASKAADKVKSAAKKTGEFIVEHKEEIAATVVTVAAVGLTVATCGAAAGVVALAGAAGGSVLGAINANTKGQDVAKGAFTGMAIGACVGGMIAAGGTAVMSYMAKKSAEAAAVSGFATAANYVNEEYKYFKTTEELVEHFNKHAGQIKSALNVSEYTIDEYLDDANYIINNGKYIQERNAYISFIRNTYYGFVGLDRTTGDITTFHIKSIYEIMKFTGNNCFEK